MKYYTFFLNYYGLLFNVIWYFAHSFLNKKATGDCAKESSLLYTYFFITFVIF